MIKKYLTVSTLPQMKNAVAIQDAALLQKQLSVQRRKLAGMNLVRVIVGASSKNAVAHQAKQVSSAYVRCSYT